MMRASWVVKRQLARIASWFRCPCQALVSCFNVCWSGIRRSRHWRASTPSSISAMFSQLPCLGGVDFQLFGNASRLCRLYRDERRWRSDCPSPRLSGLCPGSPHPPVVAPPGPSQPWFAGVTSTRRHPSKGANSMNRLLTPLRSYSIVGHGSGRGARGCGSPSPVACWSRPGTPAPRCPRTDGAPARPPWHRRIGIGRTSTPSAA